MFTALGRTAILLVTVSPSRKQFGGLRRRPTSWWPLELIVLIQSTLRYVCIHVDTCKCLADRDLPVLVKAWALIQKIFVEEIFVLSIDYEN